MRRRCTRSFIQAASGAFGNAAARTEAFVASGSAYGYGSYADIDGLFREQATELDRTQSEAMLRRIRQLIHEKMMLVPIWQLAALTGAGPTVEESGIGLGAAYAFFSAPSEVVKL
jgi:peptide/nickel transport system substrate-binding protein